MRRFSLLAGKLKNLFSDEQSDHAASYEGIEIFFLLSVSLRLAFEVLTPSSRMDGREGPFMESRVAAKGSEYLIEVIQQLSLTRSLDEIIKITRSAARELTGADGASFVLRDGEHCFYVDEDAIGPLWKGKRFPMSTCISGWAMLNRQEAVIEDIYKDSRIPAEAYRPTFVKSLAMVPIRQKDPIGAIGNYWASNHKATAEEVHLLKALANSTSIALENVQLISDLKDAKALLESALRSRDEFLAVVSHELRTPLTTLKLQLQMSDRDLKKRSDEALTRNQLTGAFDFSLRKVESLNDLIEQLVDVSRIRLGKLKLDYAKADFCEIVRKTVEDMAPTIGLARCPTELDLKGPIDGEWDVERVRQIVSHLISNACKFAFGKPVRISAHPDGHGSVIFCVTDQGPGIPKEMHRRIFDRFERAVTSNHVSGLGLGLFIVKSLVKAHRGHVRVESEPGQGAKFIVEIPLLPPKS